MNKIEQTHGTGIAVAALVGAAVGVGIGLLCAPCSGRETRGWLAHRTRDLKEKTTAAYEQGKAVVQRAATELGTTARDAMKAHERPVYGKPGPPPTRS